MSKPKENHIVFKDKKGYLCAVRKDFCDEYEAEKIAKERLVNESVIPCFEYGYMYHGFGKDVGSDEYENTWWLVGEPTNNSIPVYVFRENLD